MKKGATIFFKIRPVPSLGSLIDGSQSGKLLWFAIGLGLILVTLLGFTENPRIETSHSTEKNSLSTTILPAAINPTEPTQGFLVFVEGDAQFVVNETESSMAIGGDLIIDNYTTKTGFNVTADYRVAIQNAGGFTVGGLPVALVVGGRIQYNGGSRVSVVTTGGQVKLGDCTGTTITNPNTNQTKLTGLSPFPEVNINTFQLAPTLCQSNVLDFAAAFTEFRTYSSCMAGFPTTTEFSDQNGNPLPDPTMPQPNTRVVLTNGQLNVINTTFSSINMIQNMTFQPTTPSASTPVIINIDGEGATEIDWNLPTPNLNNFHAPYIIYNIYNVESVYLVGNPSLEGTLYAPNSNIYKETSANIEGNVIAKTFVHGGGEIHDYPLNFTIECQEVCSSTPAVPTGSDITECAQTPNQTLIAMATAPVGSNVVWYDAPSGGTQVLTPTLSTVGTITYYAESVDLLTGCASSTRTAVSLTLQNCSIELLKTGTFNDESGDGFAQVGETITYNFTVSNTGDGVLSNVAVTDPLISVSGGPIASLAPGAIDNTTFSGSYTLTELDLLLELVINIAAVSASGPGGNPVIDESDDPNDPTNLDPDLDGEPDDPTEIALLVRTAVSGRLYIDANGNGLEDPGESGLPNVDVIITDSNNNTQTVTTNAAGDWIAIVPAGTTVADVDEADPDFPVDATQTQGDDPTTAVAVTGLTVDGGTDAYLPCLTIEAWVYLEGGAIFADGSSNYALPMRTNLNTLRLLPGQTYNDLFFGSFYTPAGQPYNIAPWNYPGLEGNAYDSGGDVNNADAGYPATVVDWVLVSLRADAAGTGGPLCQTAALLHQDGSIEFVAGFSCCKLDLTADYFLVVEHYNHLLVMSPAAVAVVDGKISYDFRGQQSYIDDPFGFGIFVGQKEIAPGTFVMLGGNGNQTLSPTSDTDNNFDDRTFWESQNGTLARYRIGDYNLNGDTNFNDRPVWETNNGLFTSVPRN